MSDEVTRSTPGNPPDQRRQKDAPAWWADLERSDLPRDHVPRHARTRWNSATPHITVIRRTQSAPAAPVPPRRIDRVRSALVTAVIVLLAAAVAWLGIGGGSGRSMLVSGLLFGVPTLLAVITASVILRRGG
jgi:hypothetical protein